MTRRRPSPCAATSPTCTGFLERKSPKVLSHQDAETLAGLLACQAEELHHPELPTRRKGAKSKKRRAGLPDRGPMPLVPLPIPEVDVEASAGPGCAVDEFVAERARWFRPEGMIRYDGGAAPGAAPGTIRVLRVRGESMEPELSEGDRLLVDTARRVPQNRRDVRALGRQRAGGQARRARE